jgi:hypothetical protein
MRTTQVTPNTVSTRYFHLDHLSSIAVITNESGAVVERLSYDAWGKRRFPARCQAEWAPVGRPDSAPLKK